jgi:hypothetical protein
MTSNFHIYPSISSPTKPANREFFRLCMRTSGRLRKLLVQVMEGNVI